MTGNIASVAGGAIDLETDDNIAEACVSDFRLDGNKAPDGSAIFANSSGTLESETGRVWLQGIGVDRDFVADHLSFLHNSGGNILKFEQADGEVAKMTNCLFGNNSTTNDALIRTTGDSPIDFEDCTFADNNIGYSKVFSVSDDFTLINSIVWQPLLTTLAHEGGNGQTTLHDILASETGSISSGTNIFYGDPRFYDPAHDDFHLQAAWAAVDASSTIPNGIDLDGHGRNVDLELIPNQPGPGDLGAYELQSIGNLVRNGAFDTDLRLWTENTAGADTLGAAFVGYNSNYDRVSISPAQAGRHVLLSQCVWIPAPGEYQLSASGVGANDYDTNAATMHWAYLAGTDDTCAGPPTLQGDVNFPSLLGYFPQQMDAPIVINVPASAFGLTSALLIQFEVTTSAINDPQHAVTGAAFDNVVLVPAPDQIFKDGFDVSAKN